MVSHGCHSTARRGTITRRLLSFLLDKGAAVDAQDEGYRTAIYGAAVIGNPAVVQMLLKQAIDPTISGATLQETPLVIARKKGHAAVVQELSKNHIQRGLGQTNS